MRLSLLRFVPALLAASVPLCFPAAALAQSRYSTVAEALTGFIRTGATGTYVRSADLSAMFSSGVLTRTTSVVLPSGAAAITARLTLSSLAGGVAAAAVRATPALATASLAVWLGGLVWDAALNKWRISATAGPADYCHDGGSRTGLCNAALFDALVAGGGNSQCFTSPGALVEGPGSDRWTRPYYFNCYGGFQTTLTIYKATCPAGTGFSGGVNGTCVASQPRDAVQGDWDAVAAQPLPDLVANNPSLKDVPLPVNVPAMDPVRVVVGAPYKDPVDGKYKAPAVDITNKPTTADPWDVDVEPRIVLADDPTTPANEAEPAPGSPGAAKPDPITCGLPGTPPCKIDETGTPSPDSVGTVPTGPAGPFTPTIADHANKINEVAGSIVTPSFGFFGAPAVAACTPFEFVDRVDGRGATYRLPSIDACGTVDGIRGVMAYIWALAGGWLILGMIRRAVGTG